MRNILRRLASFAGPPAVLLALFIDCFVQVCSDAAYVILKKKVKKRNSRSGHGVEKASPSNCA